MAKDCGCLYWRKLSNGSLVCKCGTSTLTQGEYDRLLCERLIPAHERIIEMLEENPSRYLVVFAEMYMVGVKVPKNDILRLAVAFGQACNKVEKDLSDIEESLVHRVETLLLNQVNN